MSRRFLINLVSRSAGKTTVSLARPSLKPVFMPPAPTLPGTGTATFQPSSQGLQQNIQGRANRVMRDGEIPVKKNVERFQPTTQIQSAPKVAPPIMDVPGGSLGSVLQEQQPVTPSAVGKSERQNPSVRSEIEPGNASLLRSEKKIQRLPGVKSEKNIAEPNRAGPEQLSQQNQMIDRGDKQAKVATVKHQSELKRTLRGKGEKTSMRLPPVPESLPPDIQEIVIHKTVVEPVDTPQSVRPAQSPGVPVRIVAESQERVASPKKSLPSATSTADVEKVGKEATVVNTKIGLDSAKNSAPKERVQTIVPEIVSTANIERTKVVEKRESRGKADSSRSIEVASVTPAPAQRHTRLQPQPQPSNTSQSVQVSIGMIDLKVTPTEQPRQKRQYRRRPPQGFAGFHRRRTYSGWED